MKRYIWFVSLLVAEIFLPKLTLGQTSGDTTDIGSLQQILDQLYSQMMPLCSSLIGVGRGIAGFAATWFIAARVWRHLANAEPINFYPLLRPFAIGIAILLFPSVIEVINGVMQPTVTGTAGMVHDSDSAITLLLREKELAIKQTDAWQMYVGSDGTGDRDKWYKYTHPEDPNDENEGWFETVGNDIKFAMSKASYNFRNSIKQWMSEVLEVLYETAALCINTIRTFYLIVLAILGPLVFGIAVFDGFQYTLTVWIARYINIYLWLPVANIFGSILGKIQQLMLKLDLQQVQNYGDTFFNSTDVAYLAFMIIGIVGYFTVPSVANYIVSVGSSNTLLHKVTSVVSMATRGGVTSTTAATSTLVNEVYGNVSNMQQNGYSGLEGSHRYSNTNPNQNSNNYMQNKISGKQT